MILRGDPFGWEVPAEATAVAIGVFDGVHLGHQRVVRDLATTASGRGLVTAALTFDPHPLEFLAPERAPQMLTTVEQRAAMLGECGVEILGVLPFLEIRDLDPHTFVTEILVLRLRAAVVAVGENFRFGRDRGGDAVLLRSMGDELGFTVEIVEMVDDAGEGGSISSTRIRDLLHSGDVQGAARLLGRPFALIGPVIHGDARGRTIGFPTANLHVPDRMVVPADGVYAAWVEWNGVKYPGVVNIGVRPTFGVSQRTIEAHVIGFDADLYGESLTLHFVDRIRAERRFDGIDALVAQIGRDRDQASVLLAEGDDSPGNVEVVS
ncbi:MAG TPA: bifunctional riboflavin kinase/FAD synthetase [Acidimicrobiia bacterium]|nr:bifunctional riboflavin kinase/FAD synthetase [Acidimicrobiia bacterium]